jgi:hypothetical protein
MKIDEIILGGTKKRLHRDPRKRRHVRDDNLYDVNLSDLSETELDEVIRKMGDQFRLYSKKGKNLGTYDSRAGAEKREKQVNYFKHMSEGYKIQLERADDMYILHILDTETNKRTEVRGKSDYETTGYDANDKLHQLLDKIGKSANISELINGEVVTINPKHPDAEKAKVATDVAFNEAKEIEPDPEGYRKTALTAPANTLVIDTKSDLDWYKLGQYISNLNTDDPHEFGQSDSDMVVTAANAEQLNKLKRFLDKAGAAYKEISGTHDQPELHTENKRGR